MMKYFKLNSLLLTATVLVACGGSQSESVASSRGLIKKQTSSTTNQTIKQSKNQNTKPSTTSKANKQRWQQKILPNNAEKFRVVQIGDSHTAGDFFTDELRRQFQAKLGNGGIGFVAPNKVAGQLNAQIRYSGSGWNTITSRTTRADFPLGGVVARTQGNVQLIAQRPTTQIQDVSFTLKPLSPHAKLTISANGKQQYISGLQQGVWQHQHITTQLPFTYSGNQWEIGQIYLENHRGGGAVVSALGINGAQLSQFQKWRTNWFQDLQHSQADLIILAFGTNEAFNDRINIQGTEQFWLATIKKIKQVRPNSGIIILGAPESLKSTAGHCGVRPAMLDAVQAMQQRVAEKTNVLFWSWEKAMGGRCSMKKWITQGLAAKDGVHFSAKGYQVVARHFAQDILKLAK